MPAGRCPPWIRGVATLSAALCVAFAPILCVRFCQLPDLLARVVFAIPAGRQALDHAHFGRPEPARQDNAGAHHGAPLQEMRQLLRAVTEGLPRSIPSTSRMLAREQVRLLDDRATAQYAPDIPHPPPRSPALSHI